MGMLYLHNDDGQSKFICAAGHSNQAGLPYHNVHPTTKLCLMYTVNHKKRDILFLTITLVNLNRFKKIVFISF